MSRKIVIENRFGLKIFGDLFVSKTKGNSKFPLVLLCHGFSGTKDHPYMNYLAEKLRERGYCVCKFDFTCNVGKSEGKFEDISFEREIFDVSDVVDYLRKLKFVDDKRIAIAGHSLGGVVAMNALRFIDNVKCSVSLSSPFKIKHDILVLFGSKKEDVRKWQERGFLKIDSPYLDKVYRLPYRFIEEIKDYEIEKIGSSVKNHLVVQGDCDRVVMVSDAKRIYGCISEPKKLVVVEGLSHFYKNEAALCEVEKEVVLWLERFLK